MRRTGDKRTGNGLLIIPVKAGAVLEECTIAAIDEDGYAVPAEAEETLTAAGRVERLTDNRSGADGDVYATVERGTFVWENGGDITETDLLKTCYIKDRTTVTLDAEGTIPAGVILEADENFVTVDMTQNARTEKED